eukprot:9467863-Pyramimonas_sp.AAC.1
MFQKCTRATCTDRYSAIVASERQIAIERMQGLKSSLHIHCEIHKTSGVHEDVFELPELEPNISGMINCALAMRNSSAMDRFRKCMKEEITSRILILPGRPSQEAEVYKMNIMQVFVTHGERIAMKRVLLTMCPNGDWRHERVEFYKDRFPGFTNADDAAIIEFVTTGLMTALVATQPSTYPRHRWTGADRAIDELAIVEACHKLLSTTFMRFAASYAKGSSRASLLAAGQRLR